MYNSSLQLTTTTAVKLQSKVSQLAVTSQQEKILRTFLIVHTFAEQQYNKCINSITTNIRKNINMLRRKNITVNHLIFVCMKFS